MIEAMTPTTPIEPTVPNAAKRATGLFGLGEKLPQSPEARKRRRRAFGIAATALTLGIGFGPGIIDRFNGPEFSDSLMDVSVVQYGQEGPSDLTGVVQQIEGADQVPTDQLIAHVEDMPQNEDVLADNQLDPGEVVTVPEKVNP